MALSIDGGEKAAIGILPSSSRRMTLLRRITGTGEHSNRFSGAQVLGGSGSGSSGSKVLGFTGGSPVVRRCTSGSMDLEPEPPVNPSTYEPKHRNPSTEAPEHLRTGSCPYPASHR